MTVRVAIVGSGPSGFYPADALLRSGADVEIDVIDRLPTPFGLIRAGVAPDHQKTKNVLQKGIHESMREKYGKLMPKGSKMMTTWMPESMIFHAFSRKAKTLETICFTI